MALKNIILFLSTSLCIAAAGFVATPIDNLRNGETPKLSKRQSSQNVDVDVDPSTLYPANSIWLPIDHFSNESQYEPHTGDYFEQTYYFDATYYKSGGPVIMLAGGEDTGPARLPYLQKGILAQLAQATQGIAVILEHRFYGTSMPTQNLTTQSLRFLTTQQALADAAYFAQNVQFPGISDNVTARNVPWIAYGGSYAGGFVAFLRTRYPDIFFGAIASSAVTEAIYDYWDYHTPVQTYGPADCIQTTQWLTNAVDNILVNEQSYINQLKTAFGLQAVTYPADFANVLSAGIGGWVNRNWDPAVNNTEFNDYCNNITSDQTLYPMTSAQTSTVENLLAVTGYGNYPNLTNRMLNYMGWINFTQASPCIGQGKTLDQCFTNQNATFYALNDITQTWRSWPYQCCKQWGYFQTGSGVPQGQLPLISRAIDMNYLTTPCRDAFGITGPADVGAINAYGGYGISYPRLAFIDGQQDVWIGATVHAPQAPARANTTDEPSMVIPLAGHHWDENGLFANETTSYLPPAYITFTQDTECWLAISWLKEWGSKTVTGSRLAVNGTVGPAAPGSPSHVLLSSHAWSFIGNGIVGSANNLINETVKHFAGDDQPE